jgi:outer membrane receptor protein involved in Fe transport
VTAPLSRVSRVYALVGAASVLAVSGEARADGPSDLEAALSEPVVTTASQTAEDQSTAPATSTTITADDLRRYGIKTLAEAINFLSLGMVTQNNLDDGEIGTRGVLITGDSGDHVLLLVDGHEVNEQWDGTAYFGRGAGVPFELIDHIEVILGPGSVLYGSQAMLGVINVVTKRAKDFDGFHFVGEGDLFTSGRGAVGFGREFTLFGKRAELTYEMEYYSQSGPAFTFGPQRFGNDYTTHMPACFDGPPGPLCKNPGVWGGLPATNSYWAKLPDGYLRLLWGDFELDVRAESYQRASPVYPYTAYNAPNAYELDRFLSADLRYRWRMSSIAQLKSRLYGDTYSYRQQLPEYGYQCYVGRTCMYELPGTSRWVGLEEQLALDWLHDQSLTTLLGTDIRAIRVGDANYSEGLTIDAGVPPYGAFDKAEYRLAAYGQQTWRPIKWLSLNGGARFDEDVRVDDNQQYGHVSPRAVAAVTPWRNGTLKVIYSEAFRAPSYYETSYTDRQTTIPNLGLGPETVQSGEVTFEQRFGTQRVFFGGFTVEYSDMVLSEDAPTPALVAAVKNGVLPAPSPSTTKNIVKTYGPTGSYATVQQYDNLSSIDDIGINGSFEGSALGKDLRYGVNVTWAYARQTGPNPSIAAPGAPCPGSAGAPSATCTLPLTVAPEFFGNARVSYDLPGAWPVIAVAVSLVGRRPTDGAFDEGWKPLPYAPTQVEVRPTISGAVPGVPGLSYRFMADYARAAVNPYLSGPVNAPTKAVQTPELIPVDQFRTTIGLQYDLK